MIFNGRGEMKTERNKFVGQKMNKVGERKRRTSTASYTV